jgi:DNA-binding GntR family transcriptional regulator
MYSQRELVELTGATLGAVREAIPRFEAEGLLVTVSRKGLMVPGMDVRFVRDAYQVRSMIERAAVTDLLGRRDVRFVNCLVARQSFLAGELAAHGHALPDGLIERIQREDWEMHEALVRNMSNALISNIYRVTAIKIRMAVQSRLQVTGGNAHRIMKEHAAVLDRLAAWDAEGTLAALDRHIGNSLQLALGGTVEMSEFD